MKKHLLFILTILLFLSCQEEEGKYVCKPCDLPCDTLTFEKGGICPHCKMPLIKKGAIFDESTLVLNEIELSNGSGAFLIEGAKNSTIKVYYHKPDNFTKDSKILMVIPGAGRNGDSYRDAWQEEAEKYNVLILSPMFEEEHYPFEKYHLCGLIKTSNLRQSVEFIENTNIARLNEDTFSYTLNKNENEWLFNDLDRIFDLVVSSTGSSQKRYDLFGHSAGGQILHRMAIFSKSKKVDRIVASNAGFYTLPDLNTPMPFGIKNTVLSFEHLKKAFSKKLILLIGQLDNETETGGTLLRSTTVDLQGLHRLARADYFFNFSKNKAKKMETEFNWKIEIVPNVGHDHRLMGDAAAKLLYK